MTGLTAIAATLAMLAAFALIAGGAYRLQRPTDRTKGALMIGLAIVLIANVIIMTL